MAETTADLLDHVLPKVGLRQVVLTVPHPLRARLGYDGALMGALCRLFADSVLGWYTRRLAPTAPRTARGGAVLVLQRTSADLKLNPHVHAIFLDGIFVPGPDASAPPVFRPLPRLRTHEIADLLQVIRVRVLSFLVRHGVITASEEATILPGPLAERDPALVQLAAAAVSGLPPAGPERRRNPILIPLPGNPRWPDSNRRHPAPKAPRVVSQAFTAVLK